MTPKFSPSLPIPDYLEKALAPFSWSGVLSREFRSSIISALMTVPEHRMAVIADLVKAIEVLEFLNDRWKRELTQALLRFAKEGFPKR